MKRAFALALLWVYTTHLAVGCGNTLYTENERRPTAVRRQAIIFPPSVADDTILPTEVYGGASEATGTSAGIASVTPEGMARYSLPLWTPPGRAGIEPRLAFTYTSSAINGPLGMGWSLSGLSRITRCRRTLARDGIADSVHFDSTDRFCMDGQRLMVVSGTYGADGAEYRTERDTYARIVSMGTGANGPAIFKMYTKDGRILTFGGDGSSTLQQPISSGGLRTYAWNLARVEDRSGNFLTVSYDIPSTADEQLPVAIRYTGSTVAGSPASSRRVVFEYEVRTDLANNFISGFSLQLRRRLSRVEMWGPSSNGTEALLHSYSLTYHYDGLPADATGNRQGQSVLAAIKECDGQGLCRKPFAFNYSSSFDPARSPVLSFTQVTDPVYPRNYYGSTLQAFLATDVNGDGQDDLVYRKPTTSTAVGWFVRYSNGTSFGTEQHLTALPVPASASETTTDGRFTDLDGDGVADFAVSIRETALNRRTFHLLRNNSNGRFSLINQESEPSSSRRSFWTPDLNGDGVADMVRPVGSNEPDTAMFALGHRLGPLGAGTPFSTQFSPPIVPHLMMGFPVDLEGSGRTQLLLPRTEPDAKGFPVFVGTNYWSVGLRADGNPSWRETSIPREDASGKRLLFLDVNGDGLPDLVSYPQGGGDPTLALNTGMGFIPQPAQDFSPGFEIGPASEYLIPPPEGWGSTRNSIDNGVRIADLNGDGLQDIVLMDWGNSSGQPVRSSPVVLLSRGSSFIPHQLSSIPIGSVWVEQGMYTTLALDMNGDGLTDFAQLESDGALRTYVRQGKKPYLLLSVTDSEGARVEFDYAPITDPTIYTVGTECYYPSRCLRQGLWLVSDLRTDAGDGHPMRHISFHYEDGRQEAIGHRLLGFARRTVTDHATGTVTQEMYDVSTRVGNQYPLARQMTSRTIRTPSPNGKDRQRETLFTPAYVERLAADGTSYFAIYTSQVLDREYELSSNGSPEPMLWTLTQSVEDFDSAFGNIKAVKWQWSDGYVARRDTIYENRTGSWLVGLPMRVTDTATTPQGVARTRTRSFAYAPTSGLLTDEFTEPDSNDADLYLHTHVDYTPEGLPQAATSSDLLGRTRAISYEYDAATRTFVSAVTNPAGHRSQTAFHPGMGLLAEAVDANGVHTRWQYDGFGRMRAENGPTLADLSVSYRPGQLRLSAGGSGELTLLLDRLGRTMQRQTLDFAGTSVTETFVYDDVGRLVEVHVPSPAGGQGIARTRYEYDALGRITRTTYPDNAFRSVSYSGLTRTETDERGHSRVIELNGRREVARSTEPNPAGGLLTTTVEYGPFGTISATESFGHRTVSEYDVLGRRIRLIDPSSGTTVTRYNAFGDVRLVDASGQEQTLTHDTLGRVTQIQTAFGQDTYTWDTAPNGLGALAEATSADGISTVYAYDTLGRLTQDTTLVEGVLYTIDSTYDGYGRLDTLTYPAVPGAAQRLQVRYGYTARGDLLDVRNATSNHVYWQVGARTATGHLAQALFGNGVESHLRYDDNGSVRLIETGLGTADLQRLLYEYDAAGNLSARHDAMSQTTEDFGYDSLNRLTRWTAYQNCQRSIIDFTYSPDGNLTGRVVAEGSALSEMYSYGQNGAPPHALTQGPLGSYSYDARGFQVAAPGRTVEYTPYGLPRRIQRPADVLTFQYDAFQQRVHKVRSNGDSILTIGSGLYERRVEGGQTRHTLNILGDGQAVALVTWTQQSAGPLTQSVAYVHRDHLGSVEALSDESGALKQRLKFDPFGRRVFPHALAASTSPVPRDGAREGFTGHQHDDELGLIDMRGRVYDPAIGRFLTPDPFVQSPLSSQSHNRYSYVWNNPLRYTDPSGYQVDQIICGSVPEDGCAEYIGVNGPPPDPWVDPVEMPDLPWVYDSWYATGPDGRKRDRGSGWGRGDANRVTAGELMEMSPEERRAFMEQAGSGLPMPANFEAIEVHDQLSDFTAQKLAEYLRTLQYAVGMNVAAVPPVVQASVLTAAKGVTVASGSSAYAPMTVVRTIQKGEKLAEIVNEAKALTFTTGKEHALVKLASGERALVSGGPGGIQFANGQVTRIFGHTHPTSAPPSAADFEALRQLGQSQQTVLHGGQVTKIRP